MIRLTTLIESVINEIAVSDAYNESFDAQLRKYVVGVYDRPPIFQGNRNDKNQFLRYLEQVQDWAARNLDVEHTKYGIFDLHDMKFVDHEPDAYFDDSYADFDEFVSDQLHPFRYVLISPGHQARYVLGDDIAPRIVIPGRK